MRKGYLYTLLSLFVIFCFVVTVNPAMAQNGNQNQGNAGNGYMQNGSAAPPWFSNVEGFPGGPSWLTDPQEGSGPWFWQAYNGYDVSGIAPAWYLDPTSAACVPSWFVNGGGGPWWASYITDEDTESESLTRYRKGNASQAMYFQSGAGAPPWFNNVEGFPGGPSWLTDPQEGSGPWFWQAYNGYDVSGIAPAWYLDPTSAACVPSWFVNGGGGPWWSSYIIDTGE
ncbi:MAG: hypothetical protein ACMUIS_11930 [bacterium]